MERIDKIIIAIAAITLVFCFYLEAAYPQDFSDFSSLEPPGLGYNSLPPLPTPNNTDVTVIMPYNAPATTIFSPPGNPAVMMTPGQLPTTIWNAPGSHHMPTTVIPVPTQPVTGGARGYRYGR